MCQETYFFVDQIRHFNCTREVSRQSFIPYLSFLYPTHLRLFLVNTPILYFSVSVASPLPLPYESPSQDYASLRICILLPLSVLQWISNYIFHLNSYISIASLLATSAVMFGSLACRYEKCLAVMSTSFLGSYVAVCGVHISNFSHFIITEATIKPPVGPKYFHTL